MAPALPRPSQFAAIIVLPTDTLPVALRKVFLQLPALLYRLWLATITESGDLTPEIKAMICDACSVEVIT